MPKKLKKKLRKQGKKKGFLGKRLKAYIYGTLEKIKHKKQTKGKVSPKRKRKTGFLSRR